MKLWYCVKKTFGLNWSGKDGEGENIKMMQDFKPAVEMVRWVEELVCGAYRVSKAA